MHRITKLLMFGLCARARACTCVCKRERERDETWEIIYPLDAKRGRSTEHAAKTEVMPAAVPSTVFSSKGKAVKLAAQRLHRDLDYVSFLFSLKKHNYVSFF